MHVSFLFKNPSKSKIITENLFFKNAYSRKWITAKYFENQFAEINFRSMQNFSIRENSFRQKVLFCRLKFVQN